MIRVFASITDKDPSEVHEWTGSVRGWLCANIDQFDPHAVAPFAVQINGAILPREKWGRDIEPDDVVDITVQPQGVSLLIAAVTLRETLRPVINAIIPDVPNMATGGGAAGQGVDLSEIKANTARLGGTVPEIFGEFRRFPDYLVPPHRFFSDKKKLSQRFFLCVGAGEYNVPLAGRKIGESQMTALPGVSHTVYDPDEDVSADVNAEWWHSSTEVGATSAGNSGIPLTRISGIDDSPDASIFTLDGTDITIPDGAGTFPAAWNSTLNVRIESYQDYEIITGGTRDIIRGPVDQLGPFVGMKIEVAGDNAGLYEINSYTAGSVVDAGSVSSYTGSAAPSTLDFASSVAVFGIDQLVNAAFFGGNITIDEAFGNLAGLIDFINGKFAEKNLPFTAQDNGSGYVEILGAGPPYPGTALNVSGSPAELEQIFGASPVSVTGDETEVTDGEITLSYPDGDPVFGLTENAARMAIGYENMDYSIDSASTSSITVSRLTDTGVVDASWPGFDLLTSSSVVIYISSTDAAIGWAGPFTACPDGEVTEKIEYDLFFPNGLWETFGQGGSFPESQTIEIQWREAGSSDAWESEVKTVKTRSRDQIGYTFSIDLASAIRPEVRMRRAGAASTAFKFRDVEWYGLRAKLDAPSSYPWTTISVEVEDAEEIAGASENQINVIAKRKIPVLSGGEWTVGNVETADIIPALRYMAESVSMPYDDDAMVSLDSLYKSRGDTFNYVFQESTLREAMKTALGAGMAELTLDDGAIKPIRDGVRTTFEQAFSPQNMTGDGLSRSFTSVRPDEPDGVDVEYTDSQTWAQQTVECRLPGDFGDKVETLKLSGVTDKTQAWRIGMRYRRQQKYRRWEYRFNTELEGLNAGYMSYVPLLDDIPGYGQSSIMRNIAAIGDDARITVTEDMDWSGTGHVVAFRNEYGELVGPYSASMGNSNREIVADIPVDVWPDLTERQEPPHVYFGTSDKWTFPALIQSIEPSGGLQVGIRAVNYDERVYADDDNTPPE